MLVRRLAVLCLLVGMIAIPGRAVATGASSLRIDGHRIRLKGIGDQGGVPVGRFRGDGERFHAGVGDRFGHFQVEFFYDNCVGMSYHAPGDVDAVFSLCL